MKKTIGGRNVPSKGSPTGPMVAKAVPAAKAVHLTRHPSPPSRYTARQAPK